MGHNCWPVASEQTTGVAMSFLNIPATTPAQTAANQVRAIARQQYQQLAMSGLQGYNLIWRNPKATAAEVVAALETDAEPIFGLAVLNIDTLTSAAAIGGIAAPTVPSVPGNVTLTFDSAGNGTVTDIDFSSSSSSSSSSSGSGSGS
jgi:hypothetical protein